MMIIYNNVQSSSQMEIYELESAERFNKKTLCNVSALLL